MRTALLLAVASVTFSSIPLLAQQAGASVQQSTSANATGSSLKSASSTTDTANTRAAAASATTAASSSSTANVEHMSSISGELQGKLDAKSAKVGEPVVLKTTEKVTTADGTVIPKGTRLIGHVTEAQAHDSAHADSQLGIAFDRAEMKNGQSLAIHSTIESVNPRPVMMASTLMNDDDSLGGVSGGGMGGGRASGGARVSGGGLVRASSSVDRVDVTQGSAGEHMDTSASGAVYTTQSLAHAAGHTAGNATANTAAGAHEAGAAGVREAGATGHAAASTSNRVFTRSTGIPGVMLHTSDAATASGTLSASKQNVHLDNGTQMDLSFAATGK